jgi:hypothetical protein
MPGFMPGILFREALLLCPKCESEQLEGVSECSRCGIVFAKYERLLKREGKALQQRNLDVLARHGESSLPLFGQLFVLLILIYFSWQLIPAAIASNVAGNSFMHLINLPFHEAGHVLFRLFGRFMHSLGGSLGQLMMPLICFFVIKFKTRDAFGAAACLWWFGENFVDMAPYMNDARSLSLPLVGGNFGQSSPYGFHDWEFLLTESGLQQYDHAIARGSHLIGSIMMLGSVGWAGLLILRQWKR